MSDYPSHAEIHVVSDIHMGGKPGFQIFKQGPRLANYVNWLAAHRPGEDVALVLNGDVIDTLAETDVTGYVATTDAVATIKRIMADTSFCSVWDALAKFVRTDRRTLVIVIGNHDIEMSFSGVQRQVLERLAGDDAAARGRVVFSTMGAGYGCTVGNSRIFCTHGNEVDDWNLNRYEDLARLGRRLNSDRSMSMDEWEANAGTRMVKDVMNQVKQRYAWIDLLKPENSAALGTLLAIDPKQIEKLSKLPGILAEKVKGAQEKDSRLGADPRQADARPTLEDLLGPNMREAMNAGYGKAGGDELLRGLLGGQASARKQQYGDAPLGAGQLLWDKLTGWLTGVGPDEALRKALKDWLKGDATFDIANKDDTFRDVTAQVGGAVHFVVTGHTHLERAIPMGGGNCYFNCGTWIRLMRFTDSMLASNKSFKPVYDVLTDGSMAAIDKATFADGPLVLDRTTAVTIGLENGKTVARLRHVTDGPTIFDPAFEQAGKTVFERA